MWYNSSAPFMIIKINKKELKKKTNEGELQMNKVLKGLVMGMLACSMLAGCGGNDAAKSDAKVMRVATNPTFAPFEFQEEGKTEFSGFDMDLIRAIGKQAGYKVEIQNMGFDALIPALNAKNIDVAIAGMSVTDERKKSVTFSEPYYTSGLVIMVDKNNNDIKSLDDLKGKRIACQIGTTGEKKSRTVEGAIVTAFNTQAEASMELKNGGADAVINDAPVVEYYLAQGGNQHAKCVGEKMDAEQYAIAVKMGNDKLAADIDKAMAEMKKSGEYDKIYSKWFGAQQK